MADVALGGQGAPLVPYVDSLIYAHRDHPLAAQNMGGIGNVTFLGPQGTTALAFDTGPGNIVLDGLVARLQPEGLGFDKDGALALAGRVDEALVQEWLARDAYLALVPPKSTGREHYDAAFIDEWLSSARARGLGSADTLATATAWTAATVADQYRRFLPLPPLEALVSGGGTRNPALMKELSARLAPTRVLSSQDAGVDPDAKEAVAFALLAYQALMGEPNVLPLTTGARAAAVLGQIAPGRNFARALLRSRPTASEAGPATEAVNPESVGLDSLPTAGMVALMHAQDYAAVLAVDAARPVIAAAVDAIAARLARGGRLFYIGAGTSGRLGVLDASECPPTFSSSPNQVQGLIAGGDRALREAVEGAEDDRGAGVQELLRRGLCADDVVVGISANGGAPYVQGALAAARERQAATVLVTCNPPAAGSVEVDHAIILPVGPEILSGSTRLKSGTATKLVLNMLSTLTMVKLGKVHDNLMADLTISNQKLQGRAVRLIGQLTGLGPDESTALLGEADGNVKRAAVMHHARVSAVRADALLVSSQGFLRPWIKTTARAAPITVKTLRDALKFFLEDDQRIDRLEADALKDLILRDGLVSSEEKAFLVEAIGRCNFDDRALSILQQLLSPNMQAAHQNLRASP